MFIENGFEVFIENGFEVFIKICQKTLNHRTQIKQKQVRSNHLSLVNEALLKEIKHRTRFRNKYVKNKTDGNKRMYTK